MDIRRGAASGPGTTRDRTRTARRRAARILGDLLVHADRLILANDARGAQPASARAASLATVHTAGQLIGVVTVDASTGPPSSPGRSIRSAKKSRRITPAADLVRWLVEPASS